MLCIFSLLDLLNPKRLNTLLLSGSIWLVSSFASAGVINLGTWSVIQYEDNQQADANWVLNPENTVATQKVNADPSMLLSDFSLTNSVINGSWKAGNDGDDDFMGFVFGYQGRGNFYLFDWKQGTQDSAEIGMSIKSVHIPSGDPNYTPDQDLWATNANPSRVSLLKHNSIGWVDNILYNFHLDFEPGKFTIEVREGASLLQAWTVNDNRYLTGKFGFYNYSQSQVEYQGFTVTNTNTTVPEPAAISVWALGAVGFVLQQRRRRYSANRV